MRTIWETYNIKGQKGIQVKSLLAQTKSPFYCMIIDSFIVVWCSLTNNIGSYNVYIQCHKHYKHEQHNTAMEA